MSIFPTVLQDLFVVSGSYLAQGAFTVYTEPPAYSDVNQSESAPYIGNSVRLSALWLDNVEMDYAWLETNETGQWENKTGVYGSPMKLSGSSDWSNFTWMNYSVTAGTVIGWRIHANDTAGNENSTGINSFVVVAAPSEPSEPGPRPSAPIGPPPVSNFTVDKDFLKAALKQGETLLDYLKISNTGETVLEFNITVEGLEGNVMVSEDSFALNTSESKTLSVAFTIEEDGYTDIYTGKLIIKAGGLTKTVLLIMEIRARKPLFDIYVNLDELPLEVMPGDLVEADILLYNFGDLMPVDVILYYSLRDSDGNDILHKYDTLAVEEQKLVKRTVRVPSDLMPGLYLFYARLEYGNETAASSGLIRVIQPEEAVIELEIPLFLAIVAVFAAILGVSIVILHKKLRKPGAKPMEISELAETADVLMGRGVTVKGEIKSLRTVAIDKEKVYWYTITDKTGKMMISSEKELMEGEKLVQGTLQKTKTGGLYIRFER